jgi:ABC-2 type transport system ATP-binding protein
MPPEPESSAAVVVRHLVLRASAGFCLEVHDLSVESGSLVSIIGANGTGKSSFIESVLGLRLAEIDDISILGAPLPKWPRDQDARRRLGVKLQRPAYPQRISVSEIVKLHRELYGKAAAHTADALGIGELMRIPYGTLSHGQRQRVDLYVALAHEPLLAIMDEPSDGLDRQFAEELLRLLRHRNPQTTIIISHSPQELAISTHLLWLQTGRVRAFERATKLYRDTVGHFRAELAFSNAALAIKWRKWAADHSPLRRSGILDESRLVLYADASLAELMQPCLAETTSYTFGETSYDDLIGVVSIGAEDE